MAVDSPASGSFKRTLKGAFKETLVDPLKGALKGTLLYPLWSPYGLYRDSKGISSCRAWGLEAREFGIGGFEVLQHAALQSGTSEELNVCDLFAWGFPVLGLWFKP